MNPYVVFLLYMLAILGFVALTLLLNRVLGPKPVSSAMKLEPFECGATPVDVRKGLFFRGAAALPFGTEIRPVRDLLDYLVTGALPANVVATG